MILIRASLFFYIFYGSLILFSPLEVSYSELLPGFILSCIVFLPLALGVMSSIIAKPLSKKNVKSKPIFNFTIEGRLTLLTMLSMLSVPASIYAANFYTGLNPIELFIKIFIDSQSSYNDYQKYFIDNNLSMFSISKVPAILSNMFVKFVLILNFYVLYVSKSTVPSKRFKTSLLISIFSYVYFSASRGTSFELFELICLNFFLILYSSKMTVKGFFFSKKNVVLMLFSCFVLFIYSLNISIRFSGNYVPTCHSAIFCYDDSNILPDGIAAILFKLSAYFTFGFYYLTQLFGYLYHENQGGGAFIFSSISTVDSSVKPRFLCDVSFDCQAMWSPSIENWAIKLGLLNSLLVTYFFVLIAAISYRIRSFLGEFPVFIMNYMAFLQLISFPVGNFVGVSSASKLILFFVVCFCALKLIIYFILKKEKV